MVWPISKTVPALTKKSATEVRTGKKLEKGILRRGASLKSCIPQLGLSLLHFGKKPDNGIVEIITGISDETRQT